MTNFLRSAFFGCTNCSHPRSLVLALAGLLFITTSFAAERVVLVAGGGRETNATARLPATEAKLSLPFGVDFDRAGHLFLVEMTGQRVRRLDPDGRRAVITRAAFGARAGDDDEPAVWI